MSNLPDDLGPRLRKSLDNGAAPELSQNVISGAANRTPPKLSNPRRTAQFAGSATVLVAAVAVAALVIGPTLNRAPLFTAAASATTHSGAESANGEVPSAHGLMRIWANYVYSPGAGLSTSGGNGDVYQLKRDGSGTDRIDSLASTFGLGGQAVTKDDSDAANPAYTIGAIDGSTPALYLTWSGTGDWSYSDLDADPQNSCPPTPVTSSGPRTGVACPAVGTAGPSKAPTGDVARADAQQLFASTGLNVSPTDITIEADSDQTTATANLEVGGVKTALVWSVTWASSGKISQAYGSSVSVIDRGSYSTISAADAVARLSDSRWSGQPGPKYSGGIRPFAMLNSTIGTATGSGTSAGSGSGSSDGSTPLPVSSPAPFTDPSATPTAVPGDPGTATPEPIVTPVPVPTPPTIKVTVNTADATLLLMWDSKGDGWLVPGYAMKVENGFWDGVVSLVPGVIELPPLPSVEPDDVAPTPGG